MVNLEPLQFEMKKSKIKIKTNKKVWGRIFIVINRFDSNWTVHCEIEVEFRSITQLGYGQSNGYRKGVKGLLTHTHTHTNTLPLSLCLCQIVVAVRYSFFNCIVLIAIIKDYFSFSVYYTKMVAMK